VLWWSVPNLASELQHAWHHRPTERWMARLPLGGRRWPLVLEQLCAPEIGEHPGWMERALAAQVFEPIRRQGARFSDSACPRTRAAVELQSMP
jgi:hypothetical protein